MYEVFINSAISTCNTLDDEHYFCSKKAEALKESFKNTFTEEFVKTLWAESSRKAIAEKVKDKIGEIADKVSVTIDDDEIPQDVQKELVSLIAKPFLMNTIRDANLEKVIVDLVIATRE